jgi:exopolysaccharide biosynthesis polyprenyl glycosylphosphotransferase
MSNRAKTLLLLLVDSLLFFLALTIIVILREEDLDEHYRLFGAIFPIWLTMYFIEGLYTLRTYNPANLPISVIRSTVLSLAISFIFIYLFPIQGRDITPKTNLVLIALTSLATFYGWRKFFFKFFSKDTRLRETVLIGSADTLNMVEEEIKRKPHLGYKIIATLNTDTGNSFTIPAETQLIAIERNNQKNAEIYQKTFALLGSGVEIMDLANFAEKISGKIPLRAIDESWFIEYCGHQESRSYDYLKLFIDKFTAILMLILCIPVALILFPLLLIFHGRPIIFKQIRVGQNNRPFKLYKLRSMVVDAEKHGAQWAKPGDARVTTIGKFLRKTRLDELPQLINIIRGEMSLVGPRPERPEMIEKQLAPNIPFYNMRHLVKPGVTGWAQVTFRYGFSQEDTVEKLQFDLFYVKNRSLWLDILVILKTIKTVISGAGQ